MRDWSQFETITGSVVGSVFGMLITRGSGGHFLSGLWVDGTASSSLFRRVVLR